ncbi:hypothetical protein SB861_00260 [Paraburkholderia sp. SIMBA_049]
MMVALRNLEQRGNCGDTAPERDIPVGTCVDHEALVLAAQPEAQDICRHYNSMSFTLVCIGFDHCGRDFSNNVLCRPQRA